VEREALVDKHEPQAAAVLERILEARDVRRAAESLAKVTLAQPRQHAGRACGCV